MVMIKTSKLEFTFGNGQLRGLRKVTVAKAVTVECSDCGTIRNKIMPMSNSVVSSPSKSIDAEVQRTSLCPYCGGSESQALETDKALAV